MCHFGGLSMTRQLCYPHHHFTGAAGASDMQGLNLGGSGGDIMTLLHKASNIQCSRSSICLSGIE